MDASPVLQRIALALNECRLEAVLIGNAAAALHGAPVTTLDFDFWFRSSPNNLRKLKQLADRLGATILRPYYPAASLRVRATRLELGGATLLVASLDGVIRSKRAAGRPRDKAALPVLEATRAKTQAKKKPGR